MLQCCRNNLKFAEVYNFHLVSNGCYKVTELVYSHKPLERNNPSFYIAEDLCGIFVKSVIEDSMADRSGSIMVNDQITEVRN